MSSSPTAPTSTTASSTSSRFRADRDRVALIACGALAQPAADDRRAPRLAGRRPPAAAAAAQPAAADRRRGARARRRAGRVVRRRSPSATPTAAPTARSTRSAPSSGWRGCRGCTATTCSPGRVPARRRSSTSSPAPTCSPTSWCARSTRTVVARARPGPLPGAARRLLRPLHAGGVAGPGARRTSCARWPRRPPPGSGLPLTVVETGDAPARAALEDLRHGSDPERRAAARAGRVRHASVPATWLNVKTCRPSTSISGGASAGAHLLEEPLAGEAAGRGQPREGALVLGQEPGGLADADLGRHREQLGAVDRAGHAEQQRHRDAARAQPARPRWRAASGSKVRLLTTWVA